MSMRRRLACCTRDREISIDFDHYPPLGVVTYDGLESYIKNSEPYRNSHVESLDEDTASCSSSNAIEWRNKAWETPKTPHYFHVNDKAPCHSEANLDDSDVEAMKEKFAKLLLGEDVTGGRHGLPTAVALSNAIAHLAANVFGEMWKLEPVGEERKTKWRKEMNWLLSPAHFMVHLVPSHQSSSNGPSFEVMIPKARPDIQMTLPALQKLDSMLIDTLESMVNTEFWYAEGSRRSGGSSEGRERQSRRWWLPCPRVPAGGLSTGARVKLLGQGNVVEQVFKAAKSINDNVLSEMAIPKSIKDALIKCGSASLGDQLHKALADATLSEQEIARKLKLKTEHDALSTINKLEAASLAWRERLSNEKLSNKSPVKRASSSWPFMKNLRTEVDKLEYLLLRAEGLMFHIKMVYPCLPHSFLDASKVQYGTDIGHSILEAYSRVLSNLAYSILCRIKDLLQEDHSTNPDSPVPKIYVPTELSSFNGTLSEYSVVNSRARHVLIDQMNKSESYFSDSNPSRSSFSEISSTETKMSSSVGARTPSSGSRVWCVGKEAHSVGSPGHSL